MGPRRGVRRPETGGLSREVPVGDGATEVGDFDSVDVGDADVYVTAFEKAKVEWRITLDDAGRISGMMITPLR